MFCVTFVVRAYQTHHGEDGDADRQSANETAPRLQELTLSAVLTHSYIKQDHAPFNPGLLERDAIGQSYSPAKCRRVLLIIDEQLRQVV